MQASTQKTNSIIRNCLEKNFSVTQIANILGVTPSAVHQQISTYKLLEPEEGKKESGELIEVLEEKILQNLSKRPLDSLNPLQLGKLFSQVNGAKRRGESSQVDTQGAQKTATLVLPQFIQNQYVVINERNELKEVDGVLLESLPSTQVKQLFGETKNENSLSHNSFSYSSDLMQDLPTKKE